MLIHHTEENKHTLHLSNHQIHFLFLWRRVVTGHGQRKVPHGNRGQVIIRFEEMHKTFKRALKPGWKTQRAKQISLEFKAQKIDGLMNEYWCFAAASSSSVLLYSIINTVLKVIIYVFSLNCK